MPDGNNNNGTNNPPNSILGESQSYGQSCSSTPQRLSSSGEPTDYSQCSSYISSYLPSLHPRLTNFFDNYFFPAARYTASKISSGCGSIVSVPGPMTFAVKMIILFGLSQDSWLAWALKIYFASGGFLAQFAALEKSNNMTWQQLRYGNKDENGNFTESTEGFYCSRFFGAISSFAVSAISLETAESIIKMVLPSSTSTTTVTMLSILMIAWGFFNTGLFFTGPLTDLPHITEIPQKFADYCRFSVTSRRGLNYFINGLLFLGVFIGAVIAAQPYANAGGSFIPDVLGLDIESAIANGSLYGFGFLATTPLVVLFASCALDVIRSGFSQGCPGAWVLITIGVACLLGFPASINAPANAEAMINPPELNPNSPAYDTDYDPNLFLKTVGYWLQNQDEVFRQGFGLIAEVWAFLVTLLTNVSFVHQYLYEENGEKRGLWPQAKSKLSSLGSWCRGSNRQSGEETDLLA